MTYEFASEAPGADGLWQKRLLLLNSPPPKVLFDDMLAPCVCQAGVSSFFVLIDVCNNVSITLHGIAKIIKWWDNGGVD